MTVTDMTVNMMVMDRRSGPVSSAGFDGNVDVDVDMFVVRAGWRVRDQDQLRWEKAIFFAHTTSRGQLRQREWDLEFRREPGYEVTRKVYPVRPPIPFPSARLVLSIS